MPASPLAEILRAEIARLGPIPFRRFMELALYEPAHGYYAGGRAAIGRRGDYVTNVSVGPLFGRLLAGQFAAFWEQLGRPAPFTVVEQGANTGDFAHDLLTAAEAAHPEFFAALRYRIVEPFAGNRARQRERLAQWESQRGQQSQSAGKTAWSDTPDALPPFTGVHFSNELLDAMPVHAVIFQGGAWRERHVAFDEAAERFVWTTGPLSSPELEALTRRMPPLEGYETEANLEAARWIAAVARKLERGLVLVADYGFSRPDYYLPDRKAGTLTGYRSQRRMDDPLASPGEQDLTAHVDFTTLAEAAQRAGLRVAGFTDQHHFMVALGLRAFPEHEERQRLTPEEQRERRAFATLMHPGLMGRGFRFLALARGFAGAVPGFEYAQEPHAALAMEREARFQRGEADRPE